MGTKNNPGAFDCYAAADPDEPIFVLLARDPQAPEAVRDWALRHRRAEPLALKQRVDTKIVEAYRCADAMDAWRKAHETSTPLTQEQSFTMLLKALKDADAQIAALLAKTMSGDPASIEWAKERGYL